MRRCKYRILGFKSGEFIEVIFLSLLAEEPSYGYKLIERAQEFGIPSEFLERGIAYRVLRRLEAMDLVRSEWKMPEESGPPKRVYTITEHGKEALKEWIEQVKSQMKYLNRLIENTEKNLK